TLGISVRLSLTSNWALGAGHSVRARVIDSCRLTKLNFSADGMIEGKLRGFLDNAAQRLADTLRGARSFKADAERIWLLSQQPIALDMETMLELAPLRAIGAWMPAEGLLLKPSIAFIARIRLYNVDDEVDQREIIPLPPLESGVLQPGVTIASDALI